MPCLRTPFILAAMMVCLLGVGVAQTASAAGTVEGTGAAAAKVRRAAASPADPIAYPLRAARQGELTLWFPEKVEQGGVMAVRAVWSGPDDAWKDSLEFRQDGKVRRAALRLLPTADAARSEAVALLPVSPDAPAGKSIAVEARLGRRQVSGRVPVVGVNWPLQQISVDRKYVEPPGEVTRRIQRDRERVREALSRVSPERFWTLPLVRPVPGTVSSSFGGKRMFNGRMRSYHRGVDLRGTTGSPVLAAADGTVLLAEEQYFSGNIVFVDHGQGLVTLYCHLSAIHVKPGDRIKAGQQLGLVGATGRVTGPHLHLGALVYEQAVNPLALLALQAMPE